MERSTTLCGGSDVINSPDKLALIPTSPIKTLRKERYDGYGTKIKLGHGRPGEGPKHRVTFAPELTTIILVESWKHLNSTY